MGEVEAPQPSPGEVLVRLRFAGVNPTDWRLRSSVQTMQLMDHAR